MELLKQKLLSTRFFLLFLLLLVGCESSSLNPLVQSIDPYAQQGIEGYRGVAMTSCLATPSQAAPIRRSKGGPLTEQETYFKCVEREVLKKEVSAINNKNKKN
jgi:hypothetical protein